MKRLLLIHPDTKSGAWLTSLNFRSYHLSTILIYFVIGLTMAAYSACKPADKPWSKAYEQQLYDKMDALEKQRIPDDMERHKILKFMIARFKHELPKGVESVSQDSFKTIATKIGLEYAHETEPEDFNEKQTTVKWSKEVEQQLRKGFMEGYKANGPEDANQKCDCIIARLKKMYPDSLVVPLTDKDMASALKPCF
ncbi:MAG TPA: hypothetical protein VL442_13485 [Mucilaginibacter sp.]|jgi:hypothetical protein|nr:hypothetical protein [Mucilaginibacter sp.]